MTKTILITGATDGIGRVTAGVLARRGHRVLLHGRSDTKLAAAVAEIQAEAETADIAAFKADLSDLSDVAQLAAAIAASEPTVDVLINNAGVLRTAHPVGDSGLDVRFVVNTFAPALLTRLLLPLMPADGRIVHLSSAAQSPVHLAAMDGKRPMEAMDAYAQSKLALTMWSAALAGELGEGGPASIAVNPGSLLATNMVRDGFGIAGNDIGIGADILVRAALDQEFAAASGMYFDNDQGRFGSPHADVGHADKVRSVVKAIEDRIAPYRTA